MYIRIQYKKNIDIGIQYKKKIAWDCTYYTILLFLQHEM